MKSQFVIVLPVQDEMDMTDEEKRDLADALAVVIRASLSSSTAGELFDLEKVRCRYQS